MGHIAIRDIVLKNYRNYKDLSLQFHEQLNVITGLNGAGKTTILDAIYHLTHGKSFFTHLDRHVYRTGTSFFFAKGDFLEKGHSFDISISSSLQHKKSISIDDVKIKSLAELMGKIPSVVIAPKDILILLDSSQARRRLMDKTISHSDPQYLRHLLSYNKTLKIRNRYLKEASKKGISDSTYLDSLTHAMEGPARYIYDARALHVSELMPEITKTYSELSRDREALSISLVSQLESRELSELFKENLRKDLITMKTNAGIHKDDLSIMLNDLPIKKYGSQGQLKTAITALKLGQMDWIQSKTDKAPIVLLDDIGDKLDKERVEMLLKRMHENGQHQVFVTDTTPERIIPIFKELAISHNHYQVMDGIVKRYDTQ